MTQQSADGGGLNNNVKQVRYTGELRHLRYFQPKLLPKYILSQLVQNVGHVMIVMIYQHC